MGSFDYSRSIVKHKKVPADFFDRNDWDTFEKGTVTDTETGEQIERVKASKYGIKYSKMEGRNLQVRGSHHYMMNLYNGEGGHNYNDFTHNNFCECIEWLKTENKIDPKDYELKMLEVGTNCVLPINPNDIAENLVSYQNQPFYYEPKRNGGIARATLQKITNKAYGKTAHFEGRAFITQNKTVREFEPPKNLFRWEVKFTKMSPLHSLGVFTLADLTDKEKAEVLFEKLYDKWNRTILYDPTIDAEAFNDFKGKEKYKWNDPKWWVSLNSQQRRAEKNKMINFVKENSLDMHSLIGRKIKENAQSTLNNNRVLRAITDHFDTEELELKAKRKRIIRPVNKPYEKRCKDLSRAV
ncbi:MAG: hypothetical protein Aureis2KO_17250 [Aureisphaera sp.]